MISGISHRGQLALVVFGGIFNSRLLNRFLWRLLKQKSGMGYRIVDRRCVHRSDATSEFVCAFARRPPAICLPERSPVIDPARLREQDVERISLGKNRHRNSTETLVVLRRHLQCWQRQPPIIGDPCHEEQVRYAD